MEKESVWTAMAKAFEETKGDLAEKMMASLESAEIEGGDIRGKQSASMLIVTGEPTGIDWKDTVMDIRIDDSPEPLKELKRLIRIHKAYQHANKGDHYLEVSEVDKALAEYDKDWTFDELNGFLIKPAKWIKGTKMAYAGLRKEKDRASVIKYLNENSDSPLPLP